MIKKICSIILCILFITSTFSTVSAKQGTENAKVLFNNIKISVDDNILKPDTEPFIYQGRTYIPARALAEAMGGIVTWDEKNSTVNVVNKKAWDLKVLALATYMAKVGQQTGNYIVEDINHLVSSKNNIAFNAANAYHLKEQHKEKLNASINDFNFLKTNIYTNFREACEIIGKDYNKIEVAVVCYEQAFSSLLSAHDYLDTYFINSTSAYYFEECLSEAYQYYKSGHDIFVEYCEAFIDYIINA